MPLSFLYSCYIQFTQQRHSLCQDGGPSLFYTAAIYNSYKEGTLPVRIEASLFFGNRINKPKQPTSQLEMHGEDSSQASLRRNGSFSLFHVPRFNLYIEGTLSFPLPVRMEASLFSLQLLYSTHTRKAMSLSEWMPLSFSYSCSIQLI